MCAFSAPGTDKASVHKISARNVDRLLDLLAHQRASAERRAARELDIVVCYEAGYDGFWLARLLKARRIRTIVFDPASFPRPRRGRLAKTDRLDAEGMTRTLRAWLSGDSDAAREVRVPTVEEEDAKRIGRERKHLVEQRTRIVGRIKGLLALHGVRIAAKGIGQSLGARLDGMLTGDGRPLPPFLRRELERMLRHHAFLSEQIAEVEADRGQALTDAGAGFPFAEKVRHLATMGGVGEISATVLVAEVFHRSFASRRHLASFVGLAPSPYASGDVSRDRGEQIRRSRVLRWCPRRLLHPWFLDPDLPEFALRLLLRPRGHPNDRDQAEDAGEQPDHKPIPCIPVLGLGHRGAQESADHPDTDPDYPDCRCHQTVPPPLPGCHAL